MNLLLGNMMHFYMFWPMNCVLGYPCCFSVSWTAATALANVSSMSFIWKCAFSTASLLTEHMKRVRSASSCGSLIVVKSHVTAFLTNSSC